jgi:diaminopimelate epimerase
MSPLSTRRYIKMNGLGNEILVVDLRGVAGEPAAVDIRAVAADPATAFDQLMLIRDARSPGTDAFVSIANRDGSPAGACGNGMRCVAWAMMADGDASAGLVLETAAGRLAASRVSEFAYTVDMGRPRFAWHEIPLSEPFDDTRAIELQIGPIDAPILHTPAVVSMGNPHAIFWVDDPYAFDLARIGPMLENHPLFPERANISLASVRAPDRIVLRVWERGAGATLACGSAACAALVAGLAQPPHRARGDRDPAGRRPPHRVARERRPRADDRACRARARGRARANPVRPSGCVTIDGRHLRLPSERRRIGQDAGPCDGGRARQRRGGE